ncbi:MAG TPA: ATP-binding cassette domain-containing protein [Phycisphaerae bacterium]|nr:ATP-binding cassette domain-containing protein [Phycisphaerae bacterium]
MPIVQAADLAKSFRVSASEPGFRNALRHFFRRKYRTVEAVKPLSFTIEPGEVVGFLGPNGAGKTTTLKMLTGLIHPSSGTVSVADHVPFRRQKAFLRRITMVMGNKQQLLWDLPANESFAINGAIYDIPEAEFKRRVEELAGMLNLTRELSQPVRKLSLGERMKCELMASLLHRPEVLFLDEPTLGLDVNAQVAVRSFLRDYNRRYNATILLTSHYMADITALCRRVLLIHQGRLFYDGPLSGIIDRFAPYREVKLDFTEPVESRMLAAFGDVESNEGRSASLIIRREALTDTVERLLGALPIADLTITDPPIEKIIGELFAQGVVK